jgi:hypothetical protein
MGTMIVRYRVRDYFDWQRVFTYSSKARQAHGISNERIYRATHDGNNLIIVADVAEEAKARVFFASSICRVVDEKAAVIGQPDISFVVQEPIDLRRVERAS